MKKWFLISFIALALGVLGIVGWNAYLDSVKSDISKTQDTSMDSYRNAKSLVSFYPKYLAISSDKTYKDLKASMRSRMTDELYDELFYFDEYPMGNKNVDIKVNSIRGHKFSNRQYEFKLDLDYTSNGNTLNFYYIIGVDTGVITYVKRIK